MSDKKQADSLPRLKDEDSKSFFPSLSNVRLYFGGLGNVKEQQTFFALDAGMSDKKQADSFPRQKDEDSKSFFPSLSNVRLYFGGLGNVKERQKSN